MPKIDQTISQTSTQILTLAPSRVKKLLGIIVNTLCNIKMSKSLCKLC